MKFDKFISAFNRLFSRREFRAQPLYGFFKGTTNASTERSINTSYTHISTQLLGNSRSLTADRQAYPTNGSLIPKQDYGSPRYDRRLLSTIPPMSNRYGKIPFYLISTILGSLGSVVVYQLISNDSVRKLEEDKKRKAQQERESIETIGNEIIEDIKRYYRTNYRQVSVGLSSDKMIELETIFINLSAFDWQNAPKQETVSQKPARGMNAYLMRQDQLEESKHVIELESLFNKTDPSGDGKRIVVYGNPGAGKSTTLHAQALKWSKGNLWSNQFKLVLVIPLRDVADWAAVEDKEPLQDRKYSNAELIRFIDYHYHLQGDRLESLAKHLIELERKGQVLYLLDGYDEIPTTDFFVQKKCSDPERCVVVMKKIINHCLSNRFWLTTSRPMGEQIRSTDITYELMGFTDDNIHQFIKNFFEDDLPEKSQKLERFLRENPNLWGVARIPIFLGLLCYLWLKDESLFNQNMKITDLLHQANLSILKHFSKKKDDDLSPDALTKRLDEVSASLSRLARSGLSTGEVYFSKEVVFAALKSTSEESIAALVSTGFLQVRKAVADEYHFPHFIFRDWFAAKAMADEFYKSLPQEGEYGSAHEAMCDFMAKAKHNPKYDLVWPFFSGILSRKKNSRNLLKSFFKIMLQEPYDVFEDHQLQVIFSSLQELENPTDLPQYQQIRDLYEKIWNSQTDEDVRVGYDHYQLLRKCPFLFNQFARFELVDRLSNPRHYPIIYWSKYLTQEFEMTDELMQALLDCDSILSYNHRELKHFYSYLSAHIRSGMYGSYLAQFNTLRERIYLEQCGTLVTGDALSGDSYLQRPETTEAGSLRVDLYLEDRRYGVACDEILLQILERLEGETDSEVTVYLNNDYVQHLAAIASDYPQDLLKPEIIQRFAHYLEQSKFSSREKAAIMQLLFILAMANPNPLKDEIVLIYRKVTDTHPDFRLKAMGYLLLEQLQAVSKDELSNFYHSLLLHITQNNFPLNQGYLELLATIAVKAGYPQLTSFVDFICELLDIESEINSVRLKDVDLPDNLYEELVTNFSKSDWRRLISTLVRYVSSIEDSFSYLSKNTEFLFINRNDLNEAELIAIADELEQIATKLSTGDEMYFDYTMAKFYTRQLSLSNNSGIGLNKFCEILKLKRKENLHQYRLMIDMLSYRVKKNQQPKLDLKQLYELLLKDYDQLEDETVKNALVGFLITHLNDLDNSLKTLMRPVLDVVFNYLLQQPVSTDRSRYGIFSEGQRYLDNRDLWGFLQDFPFDEFIRRYLSNEDPIVLKSEIDFLLTLIKPYNRSFKASLYQLGNSIVVHHGLKESIIDYSPHAMTPCWQHLQHRIRKKTKLNHLHSKREQLPIHTAATEGDTIKIAAAIADGYNVNARDPQNQTPLILAVRNLALNSIPLLLENGADINLVDNSGHSALDHCVDLVKNGASLESVVSVMQLLLEKRKKITYEDIEDTLHTLYNNYSSHIVPDAAANTSLVDTIVQGLIGNAYINDPRGECSIAEFWKHNYDRHFLHSSNRYEEARDIHGNTLLGFLAPNFLIARLRFSMEMLVRLKLNEKSEQVIPENFKKEAIIKFLTEEIVLLMEEIRLYKDTRCIQKLGMLVLPTEGYTASSFFSHFCGGKLEASTDRSLRAVQATNILGKIESLANGETYQYQATWRVSDKVEHCVYVNFSRREGALVVRVDNIGLAADTRKHPSFTNADNELCFEPLVLAVIPAGPCQLESLRPYVEGLLEGKFENYCSRGEARIYATHLFEKPIVDAEMKAEYCGFPAAKVGNCTLINHNVNIAIRATKVFGGDRYEDFMPLLEDPEKKRPTYAATQQNSVANSPGGGEDPVENTRLYSAG